MNHNMKLFSFDFHIRFLNQLPVEAYHFPPVDMCPDKTMQKSNIIAIVHTVVSRFFSCSVLCRCRSTCAYQCNTTQKNLYTMECAASGRMLFFFCIVIECARTRWEQRRGKWCIQTNGDESCSTLYMFQLQHFLNYPN